MLKRDITYEDFNGNKVTETFYFNLSKPELVEMQVSEPGGLGAKLEQISKTKDPQQLIKHFKDIVLLAYGEKSEDGKYFMKSDEIRERFYRSAAYTQLFMELASDDNAGAEFVTGILPKDVSEDAQKAIDEANELGKNATAPVTTQ